MLSFLLHIAASNHQDPIVTDRPDFTESSIVVPNGRLQIESGFTREWSDGGHSLGLPEALARYGFSPNWELRFGAPNFQSQSAGGTTSGWGDLYVGAKRQLGPTPSGMDAAVIFAAFVPTGDPGFSSKGFDPEIKFCVSKDVSEQGSLSGMLYLAWPTEPTGRREALQTTLSYGHALADRASVFFEYAGTFLRSEQAEHLGHMGFVFRTNNDTQWDIHFGTTIGAATHRTFVAGGFSIRL